MKVLIKEKETGELICKYEIILKGLNYNPKESEFFDEAWENAIQDEFVTQELRYYYSFELQP